MKHSTRLFLSSFIVTVTVLTATVLMPFAEHNSARYISGDPPSMTELRFDANAVTVGIFGRSVTVEHSGALNGTGAWETLLPNGVRVCTELFRHLTKYIGEAQ